MIAAPFKVAVFNVKYSENLGDGLLASCIEHGLAGEGIDVETIDLAGRTGFAAGGNSRRRHLLKLLHRMPARARRLVVRAMLGRKLSQLKLEWDRTIAAADAVVIGGGNLFQDDDLNFPMKVGAVLDCVARHRKPLAIYGVGASSDWSADAHQLFSRLMDTPLVHLSVRDAFARDSWRRHFPQGPVPAVVPDPGLLIHLQAPATTVARLRKTVAVCVTEPVVLKRHSSQAARTIPLNDQEGYRQLIEALIADGFNVTLFCNGATEDHVFARSILNHPEMAARIATGSLTLADRPTTVAQLLRLLQSADVIVSHRLHACIAAYSLRIPHVGLGWDRKVEGFFHSVGREAHFIGGHGVTPHEMAAGVQRCLSQGIDSEEYNLAMNNVRAGMRSLRAAVFQESAGMDPVSNASGHEIEPAARQY